jgi:hypothetical protein
VAVFDDGLVLVGLLEEFEVLEVDAGEEEDV